MAKKYRNVGREFNWETHLDKLAGPAYVAGRYPAVRDSLIKDYEKRTGKRASDDVRTIAGLKAVDKAQKEYRKRGRH